MLLRKIPCPLVTPSGIAGSLSPDASRLSKQAVPSFRAVGHGLLVGACLALALSTSPAGAQENNPDESDIIYEDVNPGGGNENNPEESDIIYEDFPLDDLPEGEDANNPFPIGDLPPGVVPEPGTLALLLAAAAGSLLLRRRRARQS